MKTIKVAKAEIEWIDSTADHEKVLWWIEDYIKDLKTSKESFKSIGYIIYRDKKITTLATSLHFDKDGLLTKVGAIFSIPTGCIKKITYFK